MKYKHVQSLQCFVTIYVGCNSRRFWVTLCQCISQCVNMFISKCSTTLMLADDILAFGYTLTYWPDFLFQSKTTIC